MTYSTRNFSRAALATLLFAVAPFTFGGERPAAPVGEVQMIGSMVVTAEKPSKVIRSIADLGTLTVTAHRDVVFANLGGMTVTASRNELLADLGAMTVTAHRDVVVAGNEMPRTNRAAL